MKVQKSTWSSFVGYMLLCVATSGGAWFHWKGFPKVVQGVAKYYGEGVAIPEAFQWIWEHDFLMYAFPFVLIVLGGSSIRFAWLRQTWLVGLLGAAIASYYLFYGFALASPLMSAPPVF